MLSMIQAVLQHYIYVTNPCGRYAGTCEETSTLNVWIQTGSYILIAFSEIFASITGLEYAFTKAPRNMRSLVMGVCLFTTAVSSALGEAFVGKSAVLNTLKALMIDLTRLPQRCLPTPYWCGTMDPWASCHSSRA